MIINKCAVVTGGTKGIGKAIVHELIEQGFKVAVISRAKIDFEYSKMSQHFQADVSDIRSLQEVSHQISNYLGPIGLWVNCAGYGRSLIFQSPEDWEQWDDIIKVNLMGTINGCRIAWPLLSKPGGVVINIASITGLMAPPSHSAYSVAKAGVISLTRALGVDWANDGIRVCSIAPGPVDTDGFRNSGGNPQARALKIPLRQLVSEIEIAKACLFLATESSSQTGNVMVIDGGSLAAGCYV
jgi:3-oxoacyl-[acyl-carrier protein] reductase